MQGRVWHNPICLQYNGTERTRQEAQRPHWEKRRAKSLSSTKLVGPCLGLGWVTHYDKHRMSRQRWCWQCRLRTG